MHTFVFLVTLTLAGLFLPTEAVNCIKRAPEEFDCTTALITCALYSSDQDDGFLLSAIGNPESNTRSRYRTCFDSEGVCRATAVDNIQDREISPESTSSINDFSILRHIFSPNFRNSKPNYIQSTISRFNIRCPSGKLLHYSYQVHELERSSVCNGPNTCVDFLRLDFPTYNDREITCGLMSELNNLMGFDGMTALDVEFVTNRVEEQPGMLLYVYCNTPEFDINYSSKLNRKKRNVEDCTSPNGMGPRDEPLLPPPGRRIQEVLDRDPNAVFVVLLINETLAYTENTLTLSTGSVFDNVFCLTVENRLRTKKLSGSSTGEYGGFAQLVVSGEEAVLVQFGVNPIFLPTEEEATFISLLESGIREVLSFDDELFLDAEDELGLLPRSNLMPRISKRGVSSTFLDETALEFGNACNGALRAAACHYQDLVLGRDCITGTPM